MTLTDQQIEAGIAGQYGSVPQSWRLERTTVDGSDLLADLSDHFLGGEINVDNGRAVRATARIRISWREQDGPPVGLFHILRLVEERVILGEAVDFPRGLWVVVGMEHTHYEGGSAESDVTLHDYTSALIYSTLDAPIHFDQGAGYFACMRFLLNLMGVEHDLVWQGESVEPTLPVAYDRPIGTTYLTVLKDLADGINYETPWPDVEGVFVTAPVLPPEDEPFAVVYRDDREPRMVVGEVATSGDVVELGAIPNGCVAKIDNPFRREFAQVVDEVSIPPGAHQDLSVEADGEHLWVCSTSMAYRIHIPSWAVLNSWSTPGTNTRGIAVEPDGMHVWVSDITTGLLYRCAAATGGVVSTAESALGGMRAISLGPDPDYIWGQLAGLAGPFLTRLQVSTETETLVDPAPADTGIAVEEDGEHIWMMGVTPVFPVQRWRVSGSAVFADGPRWPVPQEALQGLALDPDGEHIWINQSGLDTVLKMTRSGLNDYGFVRYRNADPGSPVSTAARPENVWVLDSDSDPSMRLVRSTAVAADVAVTRLKRAAGAATRVEFSTLPDPRRWINETYFLVVDGVDAGAVRVASWSQSLEPGALVRHRTTASAVVEISEVTS